jgi:DNA-binding NtrC family response regulator
MMGRNIMVLSENERDVMHIDRLLGAQGLSMTRYSQAAQLEKDVMNCSKCLLVVDLEATGVSNKLLRQLKRACPDTLIIGLSTRTYHPELEEALRSHLHAVASRPIDDDELSWCLRGVLDFSDSPVKSCGPQVG